MFNMIKLKLTFTLYNSFPSNEHCTPLCIPSSTYTLIPTKNQICGSVFVKRNSENPALPQKQDKLKESTKGTFSFKDTGTQTGVLDPEHSLGMCLVACFTHSDPSASVTSRNGIAYRLDLIFICEQSPPLNQATGKSGLQNLGDRTQRGHPSFASQAFPFHLFCHFCTHTVDKENHMGKG